MKQTDIIVIGAGLVGSMVARHFRANEYEVLVIDSEDKMSASKCSGGLWKAGWVEKIAEEALHGEAVIRQYFEVQQLTLKNGKGEDELFNYVNCNDVLVKPDIFGNVVHIKNNVVNVGYKDGSPYNFIQGKVAVIVAAGYQTNNILEKSNYELKSNVDAQWGKIFEFNGQVDINRVHIWAPYRQATLFNREGFYYFGDGCTVKNPKPNDKRIEFASDRLIEHAFEMDCNFDVVRGEKEGYRPYIQANENIINQYDENLYAAVGTAKNGTVLCGYIADKLLSIIKDKE